MGVYRHREVGGGGVGVGFGLWGLILQNLGLIILLCSNTIKKWGSLSIMMCAHTKKIESHFHALVFMYVYTLTMMHYLTVLQYYC